MATPPSARSAAPVVNGLLSIAKAFSIKVIFVPDFGAKVRVSGYSEIVKGQRYIYLSRNCSQCHLVHSMQHELGHHLLDHLCPGKLKKRIPELEAPIFASLLFFMGYKDNEEDNEELINGFNENPEIRLFSSLICAGALSLLVAGMIWELVDWVVDKLEDSKI